MTNEEIQREKGTMTRNTFFFWLREAGLFMSIAGFTWRFYGDLSMGVFAGLAVGSLLFRIEAMMTKRPPIITVGEGGQVSFIGGKA